MKILFQGDSITDCGRTRENDSRLGDGYAHLVQAKLGFKNPGKYEFVNRGISGNRVTDLYARIKIDILSVKPDVMSILIGVNDVWHEYEFNQSPNGVDADKYFKIYSMLIEEIKEELPDTKIMILEPFALKSDRLSAYWDKFEVEVKKRAQKAKEIAKKYGLPFISLQDKFDEAAKLAPNSYWLADGVHPTPMGHELIKNEWIKMFNIITE